MTTILMEKLEAGDVIEVRTKAEHDDVMTVLVLLATEEFVILDPCDDSTPFGSRPRNSSSTASSTLQLSEPNTGVASAPDHLPKTCRFPLRQ